MTKLLHTGHRLLSRGVRRGNIIVLTAFALVVIVAFTAFSIDVGYVVLAKAELQRAADSAALGAALEFSDGLGSWASRSAGQIDAAARQAGAQLASRNDSWDREAIYVDPQRDIRLGQYAYNPVSGTMEKHWGAAPYNMVEVTIRRDSTGGDGPLNLFLGSILGRRSADVRVTAVAVMQPGNGFRVAPGKKVGVLPIAYDLQSWLLFEALNDGRVSSAASPLAADFAALTGPAAPSPLRPLVDFPRPDVFGLVSQGKGKGKGIGTGQNVGTDDVNVGTNFGKDNWKYDPETGRVVRGSDGILEFDLYPDGGPELPPGNRGLLQFNKPGASELKRQIVEGLNEYDLAALDGKLTFDNGPFPLDGEPGLKASLKDPLNLILAEPRALPIFEKVQGNGANARYTIVKFVGVRVLEVELEGSKRRVVVQPAVLVDSTVIPGRGQVSTSSIFTPPMLIE